MRVAHVEFGRHIYGGGAEVRYLISGLAAERVDNLLLCAEGGELAAAEHPGARVLPLPMRGELDAAVVGRIRRALRATQPDLVHAHSRRGADLYAGVAAALEGIPAILTRRVDSPELALWARLKYRPYARVVALSRAIAGQLERAGLASERIVRIASAVDTTLFRPDPAARARLLRAFDLPSGAFVIGVIAQLIPRKRHAWLFELLPELIAREPSIRVLCFGRGPLEARLRQSLARAGLAQHVVLAGFRRDLPTLLPGLDVVAHPAEREGLGVALLEAASCGVPVVAAAAGGITDVVEHGVTGFLAPPDDRAAFAASLALLLAASADERAALGAAARARVKSQFSVAAMSAAHLDLYARVLDESAAARASRGRATNQARGPATLEPATAGPVSPASTAPGPTP